MSLSKLHDILKKHLKLKKINVQYIPHLLTNVQKRTRVAVAKNNSAKIKPGEVKVNKINDTGKANTKRPLVA